MSSVAKISGKSRAQTAGSKSIEVGSQTGGTGVGSGAGGVVAPLGPELLGPELLGPELLGPELLGPELLAPEEPLLLAAAMERVVKAGTE